MRACSRDVARGGVALGGGARGGASRHISVREQFGACGARAELTGEARCQPAVPLN